LAGGGNAANDVDQSGFASPIGAQQPKNLPFVNIKIDILERAKSVLISLREI
jgi:hypothetical protein